jgi:hypothetical protein
MPTSSPVTNTTVTPVIPSNVTTLESLETRIIALEGKMSVTVPKSSPTTTTVTICPNCARMQARINTLIAGARQIANNIPLVVGSSSSNTNTTLLQLKQKLTNLVKP